MAARPSLAKIAGYVRVLNYGWQLTAWLQFDPARRSELKRITSAGMRRRANRTATWCPRISNLASSTSRHRLSPTAQADAASASL